LTLRPFARTVRIASNRDIVAPSEADISPREFVAEHRQAAPEDVAGHDCILCEGFQGPEVWTFARGQADTTIVIRPRLVVSNEEAACDAARAGIGLTRAYSYHVACSIEAGTLTTVLDEYRPAPLPVSFVHPAGRFLPIKLRAFLDFASPRLKARLSRLRANEDRARPEDERQTESLDQRPA
jgi:DNA-binding transcriptional LysR family regulator